MVLGVSCAALSICSWRSKPYGREAWKAHFWHLPVLPRFTADVSRRESNWIKPRGRAITYRASLNACFTRVSCILNRVPQKQNCWLGKVIKKRSFIRWERSFILIKFLWLGYLVYSLGNCVMKLYIETGLRKNPVHHMRAGGTTWEALKVAARASVRGGWRRIRWSLWKIQLKKTIKFQIKKQHAC